MCLILLAYKSHPQYKMILAANRDEFLDRPSKGAHFWEDYPNVLAGQDERHGGAWLGVNKYGRLAALTNYRKLPQDEDRRYKSRGQLVKNYLTGHQNAFAYLFDVSQQYKEYKPFNLLLGEEDSLYYFCSEQREISEITSPGIYGLSNHLLDTPWPKVEQGKRELEKAVFRDRFDLEDLFAILANQDEVEEEQLPETGLDWRWERALAKVFVSHENYATVSSTVILWGWDNHIELIERTYRSGVDDYQDKAFAFQVA